MARSAGHLGRRGWWSVFLVAVISGCGALQPNEPPLVPHAPTAVTALALARGAGFEANAGQWPAAVRFVARDGDALLALTDTAAIWQVPAAAGAPAARVHMRWPGGTARTPHGEGRRAARVHYLRGPAAAWQLDVPAYARVVYPGVYPGIDLVFHDARGHLEYDFVVAPGADASAVRLAFDGAALARGADGSLTLDAGGAALRHAPPLVYQDLPAGRRIVPARFAPPASDGTLQFALAAYDREQALVIDPQVTYATRIDALTDSVVDAAVDAAGNLWLTGMTASMQFPITEDAADPVRSAIDDGYVVKLAPDGTLAYATYFGGNGLNCPGGIAVDDAGVVYLAGTTGSADFPITGGAHQAQAAGGGGDGFLAKLDPDGRLLYASYFGGLGFEYCSGRGLPVASIALGPDEIVYALFAHSTSTELPAEGLARDTADADGAIVRLDRDLRPLWGRFVGSQTSDGFFSRVESDAAGNAYVVGQTNRLFDGSHTFPTTPGAFQEDSPDDTPHVVVKYTPTGEVAWATFVGPTSGQDGIFVSNADLAVAADGGVHLAMATGSANMPVTAGAYQSTLRGFSDLFVAALTPDGSALRYGTYLGGSNAEQTNLETATIALDAAGRPIVGAVTFSTDFPQRDAFQVGPQENAVAKLTADGRDLVYSSYVRHGVHVLAHRDEALYIAGRNVDPTTGVGALRVDERAVPCAGDCDADGAVLVNELVVGVRIALGELAAGSCAGLDADGDGEVGIAELIAAVGNLLGGCG